MSQEKAKYNEDTQNINVTALWKCTVESLSVFLFYFFIVTFEVRNMNQASNALRTIMF